MKLLKCQLLLCLFSVVVCLPSAAQLPSGWTEVPTENVPARASPRQNNQQQGATPYSLKGIRLGMTLEEFRAHRLPDPEAYHFPVCSCDHGPEMVYNLAGPEIGGITCEYRFRSSGYSNILIDSKITVAKIPCELIFNFIHDGAAYRLYEIKGTFDSDGFPLIAASLQQRYGSPAKQDDSPTQNRIGNRFQNSKLLWFNGVSSIDCRWRYDTIDKGAIWFTHQALTDLREKRYRDRHGTPVQDL